MLLRIYNRSSRIPQCLHGLTLFPLTTEKASAGTIKADKWRVLSTIYLPIALVTLWGDNNGQPLPDNSWYLPILDHTMALFQAVTIICRYTMNLDRAITYRNLLKKWVDGLYSVHPHMQMLKKDQMFTQRSISTSLLFLLDLSWLVVLSL